jgi:excisionase family DNA binding protein
METVLKRTSGEDQRIARQSISKIKGVLRKLRTASSRGVKIKIQETEESTGEYINIPKKAFSLLEAIITGMSEGKSITLIPSDSEVSTQQAADMLNVSRPHLVKLLESGKIPFKKVGSHRRILLEDLISYENGLKKNREEQLQNLVEQAQKLKLGY